MYIPNLYRKLHLPDFDVKNFNDRLPLSDIYCMYCHKAYWYSILKTDRLHICQMCVHKYKMTPVSTTATPNTPQKKIKFQPVHLNKQPPVQMEPTTVQNTTPEKFPTK